MSGSQSLSLDQTDMMTFSSQPAVKTDKKLITAANTHTHTQVEEISVCSLTALNKVVFCLQSSDLNQLGLEVSLRFI